jgi:glycosyltransferase involved in cell wall biosynthesis
VKTVLHTEASSGFGGQEVRTLAEARWTAERDWRVLVACQPDSPLYSRARAEGVTAVGVRMRGAWDLRAVRQLASVIRSERVSITHTHSSIDGWLGGLASRLAGVPVVRTRHVSIAIRRGWNPVYTRLADRVITSGEAIRSMVVAAGVDARRVVAIPAGVKLEDFRANGAARREALRATLPLGHPVIGSVAMFRGSKGHAHLLDAFCLLRKDFPEATLLLVGDGIRRRWVEGLAQERGVGEAVVFTGFRRDVPDLLAAMDCFVLASTRTEGVPQSLLQAFASGVPVVASAIGGIPEVVTDGVTGLLVEPENARALAGAIRATVDDRPAATARAEAARRLVESRFSHEASVSRLLALYEDVLAERGSHRSTAATARSSR